MVHPRAGLTLGIAVFAYFVTIIQRSSMGVASLAATERFDIGATALSSLAVTQLAVYAAMQIPAGLILDRFGARKLIIFGSLLTGLGNLLVASTPTFSLAILGRMVVGFGDSFIFISMIRLINGWVQGPRATRLTQLFANLGQIGQIASAVPFAYLLDYTGWTTAFSAISGLAMVAAALAVFYLQDEPHATRSHSENFIVQFKENIRDPFTRKAFWVHFTMQSSGSVFILLWGYPFMVEGEGLAQSTASLLLGSFVIVGFIVGPLLSYLCVKYPARRNRLVTVMYLLIVGSWCLVLFTPGRNPIWQLGLLVLVLGSGGPASMVAFDYSRTAIPKHRLGSSNGVINSGGFVATFTSMLLIGLVLDLYKSSQGVGNAELYSLDSFKTAMPVQLVVISIGLAMFYRERRLTSAKQE